MNKGGDFAERLKRIEGQRGAPQQDDGPIQSGGNSKLIAGCVFFGGLAMLLSVGAIGLAKSDLLGSVGEKIASITTKISDGELIPSGIGYDIMLGSAIEAQEDRHEITLAEAEAARKANLVAPLDARPAAPTAPINMDRMGTIVGAGHAATQSGTPVAIDTILAGFQPSGPNSRHWDIENYDMNETCQLRPVGTDEKLISVNIDTGHAHGPIQIVNNAAIYDVIEDHTKEALEDGHGIGMMKIHRGTMKVIDVIVTDTSAPLYLTLQSRSTRMMWHIHAGPDVNIAHIAMIGSSAPALTGNIGTASFEAVQGYENQRQEVIIDGERTRFECNTTPFRKPDESWAAWDGAKGGNTLDGNLLFGQDKGFDRFDTWFKETLGVSADTNLITARAASAVLVGNIPATPFDAPSKVTNIHVPAHDIILTGTPEAREAEIVKIYTDIVAAASGGDYRAILPETMILSEAETTTAAPSEISGGRRSFGDLIMDTNDIASKVSQTDLNRERRVSFSTRLTLDDLLQNGEAMPPEEQHHSYAMMRAPREMAPYCADTLVEIATKCKIIGVTVRDSGEGEFQIRANFAYVPNYTIGDVERQKGGDFLSAFLPDDVETRTHQTPEERRAFLVELKGICDQLRAEYGNCLIGTGGFYLDQPARFSGGDVQSHAAGWVEIYGQDNPFEEKKFQERAVEIFANR